MKVATMYYCWHACVFLNGNSFHKIPWYFLIRKRVNIITKFKNTHTTENIPGRGRKNKTYDKTNRYIRQLALENRKVASDVEKALKL